MRRLLSSLLAALLVLALLVPPPAWAAFAGAAVVTSYTVAGRRYYRVVITETGGTTATDGTSDTVINGLPLVGTILAVSATKTSGSAATLNCKIGRAYGFATTTQDHVASCTTTAAHIAEQSGGTLYVLDATGALYWRSGANTGTNNAVSAEILIIEGAL